MKGKKTRQGARREKVKTSREKQMLKNVMMYRCTTLKARESFFFRRECSEEETVKMQMAQGGMKDEGTDGKSDS